MNSKAKNFVLNTYNSHKFNGESYLVTTENGSWSLLSKDEFDKFRLGKINKNSKLYNHLKERGLILTEENVSREVKKYALKNQFLFTGPSLHIITPTMRCNQRCTYCHSMPSGKNGSGFDLDPETGRKIVDFAMQTNSDVIKFEFQGGEPLLNFSTVKEIIDYARREAQNKGKEVGFSIVSNLTALEEDTVNEIKDLDVSISTSLDGPEEIHNSNRKYLGGGGTYDDVVENIKRLRDEDVEVNALCTITSNSLERGREIVEEYLKLEMDYIWLRPLNKIGFADEVWGDVGYTAEEFVDFYSETLDFILKEGGIKELYAVLLSKKILGVRDPEMTEMTSPCGAGISQLLYDCEGDIYTCDEGKVFEQFKLGNVEESTWNDLFKNDVFVSMVDVSSKKNYLCNDCEWEPFCAVCPVNTYSEQSTVVSKLPQDFRCKVYRGLVKNIFKRLLFSSGDRKKLGKWSKGEGVFR